MIGNTTLVEHMVEERQSRLSLQARFPDSLPGVTHKTVFSSRTPFPHLQKVHQLLLQPCFTCNPVSPSRCIHLLPVGCGWQITNVWMTERLSSWSTDSIGHRLKKKRCDCLQQPKRLRESLSQSTLKKSNQISAVQRKF